MRTRIGLDGHGGACFDRKLCLRALQRGEPARAGLQWFVAQSRTEPTPVRSSFAAARLAWKFDPGAERLRSEKVPPKELLHYGDALPCFFFGHFDGRWLERRTLADLYYLIFR